MLFFIKRAARAPQPPTNQQGTKWAKKFMCPKVHILGHTSPIFFEDAKVLMPKYQKITLENVAPLREKIG